MTLTLSPPVKIAALLGILGALLLGGSMMTLGRGETSEAIPHAINPHLSVRPCPGEDAGRRRAEARSYRPAGEEGAGVPPLYSPLSRRASA